MEPAEYQVRVIQDTVIHVCNYLRRTSQNVTPWWEYKEEELWYELAACILGSRVPFELSAEAIRHLRLMGLMEIERSLHDPLEFERKSAKALSQRFFYSRERSNWQSYPFPFARATQLRHSLEAIYYGGGSIRDILTHCENGEKARLKLIAIATGIGPKQASLFLRNIGYTDELAILDTHVLRYIKWIGMPVEQPIQVYNIKKYSHVEKLFRSLAQQMGFSVAHYDIAVWVVIRIVCKELQTWVL